MFDKLLHYEADNTASSISSDPFCICPCNSNNLPNCSHIVSETFQVSVVAVGQRNGIVPSTVRTRLDRGWLKSSQYIQPLSKMCTTINYNVFSWQNVSLELHPDGPCSTFSDKLFIQLRVCQGCPPGFSLEKSPVSCICHSALQKYTNR